MRIALSLFVFAALVAVASAGPFSWRPKLPPLHGPERTVPHVPMESTEADGDFSEWDTTVGYDNPQYHRYLFNGGKIGSNKDPGSPTGSGVLGHVYHRYECKAGNCGGLSCGAKGSLFVLFLLDDIEAGDSNSVKKLKKAKAAFSVVKLYFNKGKSFSLHSALGPNTRRSSFIYRDDGTIRGFEMEIRVNSGKEGLSMRAWTRSSNHKIVGSADHPGVAITIDTCATRSLIGRAWDDCSMLNGVLDNDGSNTPSPMNEMPIADVDVTLYQCSGPGDSSLQTGVITTATTDSMGMYEFDDVYANAYPYVSVGFTGLEAGSTTFGITTDPDPETVNNDVPNDGLFKTACVELGVQTDTAGDPQPDQLVDLGVCQPQDPDDPTDPITIPGEIGGNVFEDCTPNDGIYDLANESPVELVAVGVFECDAGSPDSIPLQTTTTDADGFFGFDMLDPDVEYAVLAFLPGTAQLGAVGAGADGEIDNDASFFVAAGDDIAVWSGCKLPTREQGPMVTDVVDQAFDIGFCDDGQVTGDPHLTGFLGQKMNLLGEDGHVYNLISSPHLQYNARLNQTMYMVGQKHASLIGEMGMLVGENQVRIYFASPEAEEIVVEVNGARIMPGDNEPVLLSEDGSEWIMRTPRARSVLIVTRDYHFNVQGKLHQFRHLDDGVHLVNWMDGRSHHGMLGQTASPEKADKSSKEFVVDYEWPAFLDGSLADYDVAGGDIFGTDYTFSQFDASA